MSEPPDYNEQAEVFKKSMVDALSKLDTIADQAQKAYEQALEDQFAAKEELNRIQSEAHQIAESFIADHKNEIEARIRNEVLFDIAKTMIIDGRSARDIYKWLKIPESMMADAWMELGFTPLGNHVANVRYINEGKSGEVIFYREDIVLRFPYEFTGGDTLATVDVPTDENWQAITNLPLEDRMAVLEFIAHRIIRDQADGYRFEIGTDSIVIKI